MKATRAAMAAAASASSGLWSRRRRPASSSSSRSREWHQLCCWATLTLATGKGRCKKQWKNLDGVGMDAINIWQNLNRDCPIGKWSKIHRLAAVSPLATPETDAADATASRKPIGPMCSNKKYANLAEAGPGPGRSNLARVGRNFPHYE